MEDWAAIWERRGRVEVDPEELARLIELNGFDVGAGRLGPDQFREIARMIVRELELQPGMRVLEVGCGAGALLLCLRVYLLELAGVDYSASLVKHARAALPEATVEVAEAVELPFEDGAVDAVVCHSVFQYFPDLEYARRALAEFRRVASGALVIDVPDEATKAQAEAARAAAGSTPSTHLFYPRSFFAGAKVWTGDLPGYANAPFRFRALLDFRAGELS
jgi:SAM-dependent methyltransferase